MLSRPLSASWYRPTQRGLENPPSSHVTHHSLPPQCFGLDHSSLWIGDHVGAIHQWRLEDDGDDRDAQTTTTTLIRMSTSEPVHALHSTPIGTDGASRVRALIVSAHTLSLSLFSHSSCADCIRVAGKDLIASKALGSETIIVWNTSTSSVERRIEFRDPPQRRSTFDINLDRTRLCVGSASGAIMIFDLVAPDAPAVSFEHRRAKDAVTGCAFSADSRCANVRARLRRTSLSRSINLHHCVCACLSASVTSAASRRAHTFCVGTSKPDFALW